MEYRNLNISCINISIIYSFHRTEIVKLNRGQSRGQSEREMPQIRVSLCMNCIVMQQALSMANTALKAKMKELQNINRNANKIRIGLQLNDLALDSLEKSQNLGP